MLPYFNNKLYIIDSFTKQIESMAQLLLQCVVPESKELLTGCTQRSLGLMKC